MPTGLRNTVLASPGQALPFVVVGLFWTMIFSIPFEGFWGVVSSGFPITMTKAIGYIFFLACLLDVRRCFKPPPKVLFLFAWYVLVLALLASIQGISQAVFKVTSAAQLWVFLWVSYNLLQSRPVALGALIACAGSGLLLGALVLFGYAEPVWGAAPDRAASFGSDPNTTCAYLGVGLLSMLGIFDVRMLKPRYSVPLIVMCLFTIIPAVVKTGSRGGALALVAGTLCLALAKMRLSRVLIGATVSLIVLALYIHYTKHSDSTMLRWQVFLHERDTSGRDRILAEAWKLVMEKPLTGWGPVTLYHELGRRCGADTKDTHNVLLLVLGETGIVGGGPYIVGLILCGMAAWRARKDAFEAIPMSLLTGIMVFAMTVSWHNRKTYWLVLAFVLARATVLDQLSSRTDGLSRMPRRLRGHGSGERVHGQASSWRKGSSVTFSTRH